MKVNYYFEKAQVIKFEVYDDNGKNEAPELLGICEPNMAKIMTSHNWIMKNKLFLEDKEVNLGRAKLIIKAETVKDNNNETEIKIEAQITQMRKCYNLCRTFDHPYLLIDRARDL